MIGAYLQDRYRLDAELGQGGMGAIYRATDMLLQREVAVKVLSDTRLGTEGRARLLREAQAVAKLNHPNIVSLYDAGESDGVPFIVMELVEGQSLRDRPPRSIEDTLEIARQVCLALDHAHTHGVIHRDVKPENVLITSGDTAKLVDFGLARSNAARTSMEGMLVGTVFYLAPEQVLGQAIDARADLYALGVLLYELTAGRLPFIGDDPIAVISQHLHAPVVPPSTFNMEIPAGLDALILRLMSKRAADRPASAAEVAQMIDALMDAAPEAAPAPTQPGELSMLDRIVRGRLVGRQSELNQLHELWTRAQQDGHSHLALISGEPGIGKTRLAHEVIVYAQLNGAVVLRGGCYEYEAATPYLPFVEALREWVRDQSAERLRAQLGTTAPEIAKLAPEIESKLGPLAPNPALPPDEERLRLFDNLARFLQGLAAERGLLLFIDDLHWADQATLLLLHYLLRHLRKDRALVLAAYREVELDRAHPLAAALVEWNRERLATRIPLDRLSLDETGALLAALFGQESVSQDLAQAMHRETEGNPFFLEEVVKSLIEQGQIYRERGRWERKEIGELAIPQSVKEAIGRRLNRLSAGCIDVLHTAAALGKVFTFRELSAAVALDEDQLLNALDEASAAQLVHAESGEAFAFTHDKIREVLYEELNPIRRQRLHQRIGESLIQLYGVEGDGHAQDLAYHFMHSGDLPHSLAYSLRAAESAERVFAHDEALQHYGQARDAAEALNLANELPQIDWRSGDIFKLRGLTQAAVKSYESALGAAGTRAERAALKADLGDVYANVGDPRGEGYLQQALEELDPQAQTNKLALTMASIGRYHHYRTEHSRSLEFLERARQLAEPIDDPETLTQIYSYLAGAYQHLVRYDESNAWARRSIALGERKDYPVAIARGYEFLSENAFFRGFWDEALDFAAHDREIGQKIGALARVAWSDFSRASALRGKGQLREAREVTRAALDLCDHIGEGRLATWLDPLLAMIEADLGDDRAAQEHGERGRGRADALGQLVLAAWSRHALGYWHIGREEWEAAAALYQYCLDQLAVSENRVAMNWIGADAAQVLVGYGRMTEAEQLVQQCLELAQLAGTPHCHAMAQRVQGQILAAQRKWDDATRVMNEALATLDQLGSRLELGRLLLQRGRLRQSLGDRDAAYADWSRAQSIFEACGAVRDLLKVQGWFETG